MSSSKVDRTRLATALDVLLAVVGVAVAVPYVLTWVVGGATHLVTGAFAMALIVVMSRFPLVLTHRSGDVVIGFETCVLVYLVLTAPPVEAFAIWSIGTALANLSSRKVWRSRIFNTGLTILGGGLLVLVVTVFDPGPSQKAVQLVAVMLGCAVYFFFDLLMTACSLAIEDGCTLSSVLRWRSVPLGLACFVSVDTLGYLAALLGLSEPGWTLLLLLVPVGTILVAVRSVSHTRQAQARLSGLLEAAIQAPDWSDVDQIESLLLEKAQRTLRHTTATLRSTPAVAPEIGAPIEVEGRPTRHLVVRHHVSGKQFDPGDRAALEALTAVGVSALNRRRLSDQMTYLARHDVLTGLHNRSVFAERLRDALARRAPRGLVAVLYCDLDGFKEVNDLLGHEAGDRLLVAVAHRVLGCLRPEDTAARLGGDEFGILLDDLTDESQAQAVADRLLDALNAPFHTAAREIRVQASIGITFTSDGLADAEDLINNADTAMYAAKARGKGRAERFVPAMRLDDLNRLELEAALRLAVRDGQVQVHFQPIVDLRTGEIDGFEALARWTHPTLGVVPPDRFIPIAERLGLIRTLGLQLLEQAHDGAVLLSADTGGRLSLGVNLSVLQLTDPALLERVEALVRATPDVHLLLEITEGTLLGDDPVTNAALSRLKACGARLAIDDFGVGYSSISYLHRLPVDILKIDKLFVAQLHDPRSRALVEGVIAMARAMQLTVITEGVEDWASAAVVRDLGCHLAQGYVFSRPLDLAGARALVAAGAMDLHPHLASPV